jgi:hypothetical protein
MKLIGKAFKGVLKNGKKYRIGIETTSTSLKVRMQVKHLIWLTMTVEKRIYNIGDNSFSEALVSALKKIEPIINKQIIINE